MSEPDPVPVARLGDPPEAEAPTRLGRYTVLEEYARGGMAQVFLAQRDAEPEIRILKRLLVEWEPHEVATLRFQREAQLASLLDHDNIAQVTDTGFEGNSFCIAMEFIAGKDVESMMHRLLAEGRMLPAEISVGIVLGILEGLAYAHDARDPEGQPLELVHRDLSPRNVLVSWKGEVKIIDFGLAYGRLDDFKTAPGMILGTLRYASPEQARTQPLDRRSDLYTVGVVLYEMLTGRLLMPFGKPGEVLAAVTKQVPEPLSALNPNLPRALDAVLAKALEKKPEDRYSTAQDFRDALLQAAGPLAHATPAMMGDIARRLFPEEERRSAELIAFGKRRFEEREARWAADAASRPIEELAADGPAQIPTAIVRQKSIGSGFSGILGETTEERRASERAEHVPTMVVRKRGHSSTSRGAPPVLTLTIPESSYSEHRAAAFTEVGPAKPVRSVRSMPAIPLGRPNERPRSGIKLWPVIAGSAALGLLVLLLVARGPRHEAESTPPPVGQGVPEARAAHSTVVVGARPAAEPSEPSEVDAEPEPALVQPPAVGEHAVGEHLAHEGRAKAPSGLPVPSRATRAPEGARRTDPKKPEPEATAPPPVEAPKRAAADPYAGLYDLLERARRAPDDSRLIDELVNGILKAADQLTDPDRKTRIKSRASSSQIVHDLGTLETCLKQLSAARRAQE